MERLTRVDRANLTDSDVEANAIAVQRLTTFNIELRSVRAKLQSVRIDQAEALRLVLRAYEQWRTEVEG